MARAGNSGKLHTGRTAALMVALVLLLVELMWEVVYLRLILFYV